MVTFFPDPYPDELLYSILARYHVRSGNIYYRTTMKDLFGNSGFYSVVDLPCHIDTLIQNLPFNNSLKKKELILNHTLYPFYTAFLPADRAKSVYNAMRRPYGENVYIKTGITTSSVHIFPILKFCPDCCQNDLANYGEYYWHRIHNTPGVLVCPVHKIVLQDSLVKLHADHKQGFSAAGPDNCLNITTVIHITDSTIESLAEIARDILWLYNNYELIRRSQDIELGFRRKYVALLGYKGLINMEYKKHFWDRFIDDIHNYFGSSLLKLLQSDFSTDNPRSWPIKIIRKHDKSFHPIRHVLMMRYLCGSLEKYCKIKYLKLGRTGTKQYILKKQTYDVSTLEKYRSEWTSLKNKYPSLMRSLLASKNYRLFTWLRRNDRTWLDNISPLSKSKIKVNRIDWVQRDKAILAKAKILVRNILNDKAKPKRITVNLIGKITGTLAWLKRHPKEMPETVAFLYTAVESVENYQLKRIEWIAAELHSKEHEVKEWEIKRLSGIRPGYSQIVSRAIAMAVEKYALPLNIMEKTG